MFKVTLIRPWTTAKSVTRGLFGILLISMLILLTGCGQNTEGGEGNKIRVGFFPNITHVQPIVGFQKDSFSKALGPGIEIEKKIFNAGPAELEALLTNRLDIGYIGPVPAFNGYIKSQGKIKIIAGAVNGGASLVVRPQANINSVRDLAGKKVAIPQYGNTQDIILLKLLADNQLKTVNKGGSVQVLQISNPDMLALFAKGEIDAALVPEPWGTRLVQLGNGQVLLDWQALGFQGNYATTVIVVRTAFLQAHPELVGKWLQAHDQLTQWIKQNPGAAKQELTKGFKEVTGKALPPALVQSAFGNMQVTTDPGRESIKLMAEISEQNGYVKQSLPIEELFAQLDKE